MKKRIVTYGTSLTSTGGWVKLLKKELPDWKVINSGKGGMNSNWGLDNFGKKVLKYNPHVVLMEFSVNDAYVGEPFYKKPSLAKSLWNIRTMIGLLKWSKVFYMTMNPPLNEFLCERNPAEDRPEWERYYRLHRFEAHSHGAEIINITARWQTLDKTLFKQFCPDGLHPNELGSRQITIPAILERLEL